MNALAYKILREEVAIVIVRGLRENSTHKIDFKISKNLIPFSLITHSLKDVKYIRDNSVTLCSINDTRYSLNAKMLRDTNIKNFGT